MTGATASESCFRGDFITRVQTYTACTFREIEPVAGSATRPMK